MPSLRTQLRAAILARLQALPYRVLDNSRYALQPDDCPLLVVRLEKAERLEDWTSLLKNGVCVQSYEMPVVIEGVLCEKKDLERELEDMALDVMQVFDSDPSLGGLCKLVYWDSGVEVQAVEGEQALGRVRLVAKIIYRVAAHAPNLPWN